jgi:VWFA-related protein
VPTLLRNLKRVYEWGPESTGAVSKGIKKMKTNWFVIFIGVLLLAGSVSAQETEISRLKTQTITLTRKARNEGKASSPSWTLVEGNQKRSYSIVYGGLSLAGDNRWLQLTASPNGGWGWLVDLGEMNWSDVDRMPALGLKPIPQGITITQFGGETIVLPQGFIVKAVAGHIYAVHIEDDRKEYRAIFRVESIDSGGECKLSWKHIPSKWALGPGTGTQAKQSKANDNGAKILFSYSGPPAKEILTKVASVYASCRSYSDEGVISSAGVGSSPSHFRTTFSRPDTLGFELWQGTKKPWVIWKKGDEISNQLPDGSAGRPMPLDNTLAQLAFVSRGGSVLIPPLLIPSFFRMSDALALIVDPRVSGEDKVDGLEAYKVSGSLMGEQIELWIDKTDYLIRKVARTTTLGNQQLESTIKYKPRLNSDIPSERLVSRPPTGQGSSDTENSMSLNARSPSPPSVAPRLSSRAFGSSLSRRPNERAIDRQRSADDDVVRVDTDLVLNSVLVLDTQGKSVTGLTKEDFILKEDNNLQQVASFSLGDNKNLSRSIVLIIDYSPSQLPYIRTSIEAAKILVDKLNPKDRMALVTDDVKLLADFTSDKHVLKDKLDSLKNSALSGALGASLQYDALMATLNELFNNEDTQPIVIFQTDGDQLDALKGGKGVLGPYVFPRKYGLEDILTATERVRATIYPVISGVKFLGVAETEMLTRARLDWVKRRTANIEMQRARNSLPPRTAAEPGDDALQRNAVWWFRCQTALAGVAKSAGAWAEFLEEPDQADEIYTRVLQNIERRYVLGYYPTNRTRDGKRRTVSVEVRNHPDYVVVGRKSYLAPEQ